MGFKAAEAKFLRYLIPLKNTNDSAVPSTAGSALYPISDVISRLVYSQPTKIVFGPHPKRPSRIKPALGER